MQHNLRNPLTKEGHAKLASEHEYLTKHERPKIVEGIATAAAEGDRSENAEYIYGKKRLRELDKRIRYLNKILKDAQIIDPTQLSGDKVCFGSTVVVEDENGEQKSWTLVGEGESDHHSGKISWNSPVAKAIFGKRVGDMVTAHRPIGPIDLEIIDLFFASRRWCD